MSWEINRSVTFRGKYSFVEVTEDPRLCHEQNRTDLPGLCLLTGDFTGVDGKGSSRHSDWDRKSERVRRFTEGGVVGATSFSMTDADLLSMTKTQLQQVQQWHLNAESTAGRSLGSSKVQT